MTWGPRTFLNLDLVPCSGVHPPFSCLRNYLCFYHYSRVPCLSLSLWLPLELQNWKGNCWDCLMAEGTCYQGWRPEPEPQNPYGRGRELTSTGCPLTFTHTHPPPHTLQRKEKENQHPHKASSLIMEGGGDAAWTFFKNNPTKETPQRMWPCLADVYLGITQHLDRPSPLPLPPPHSFRWNFAKRLIFSKKSQKDDAPS